VCVKGKGAVCVRVYCERCECVFVKDVSVCVCVCERCLRVITTTHT
jgi:hypothetical protein